MIADIVITLGKGEIAIGANKTNNKEVNNPFISFEYLKRELPIGTKPEGKEFEEKYSRIILDILNEEGLQVLEDAVHWCKVYFQNQKQV